MRLCWGKLILETEDIYSKRFKDELKDVCDEYNVDFRHMYNKLLYIYEKKGYNPVLVVREEPSESRRKLKEELEFYKRQLSELQEVVYKRDLQLLNILL